MTTTIDGVSVRMGGRDFVVAPLTFRQLRQLRSELEQLNAMKIGTSLSDDDAKALCKIVHASLSRNHPEVKQEEVEDLLDIGNALAVITAILTGSGLKPGEAKAASV
jgi:hypothetical protein